MSNIESNTACSRLAPRVLILTHAGIPLYKARICTWLCMAAIAALAPAAAHAAGRGNHRQALSLGVESWLSTGRGSWGTSYGMPPAFESRLEWEDLNSHAWLFRVSWQPVDILRVGAAYGIGMIPDGSNTDSDRIQGALTQQSISNTDGDLSLVELSLDLRLNETIGLDPDTMALALRIGFLSSSEQLTDRDDLWTMQSGQPTRQQYTGDNATYDFEWSAFQLGLAATRRLGSRLTLNADASWLTVKHNGQGFWMTNTAFENRDPNLENSANGYGILLNLGLAWHLHDNLSASLGWRWQHLEAENGEQTQYLAGGAHATANLDAVTSERSGLMAAIQLQF